MAVSVWVEVSHDDRQREAALCSSYGNVNLYTHCVALELRFASPLAWLCLLALSLALGRRWVQVGVRALRSQNFLELALSVLDCSVKRVDIYVLAKMRMRKHSLT